MTQIQKREQETERDFLARIILTGDTSKLSPSDKLEYIKRLCEALGVNVLTQPFSFIRVDGGAREILYANRSLTDQLASIHKITRTIINRERLDDVYIVEAQAATPEGRVETATGAVSIAGLKGNALANALMKAETKAKRRATLAISGLAFLDESEVETIPNAQPVEIQTAAPAKEIKKMPAPKFEIPEQAKSICAELNRIGDSIVWNAKTYAEFFEDVPINQQIEVLEERRRLLIEDLDADYASAAAANAELGDAYESDDA